nr:FG-GAP repeat protein [Flavobacteriales bacterium]
TGTPFDGVYWSSIAFADVDGDGDQDVLITGQSNNGNISKLYLNTTMWYGCTDSLALNYNPLVTIDDGSCCYDCGRIEGFIYEDLDSNSVYDSLVEIPLGNQMLQLEKSNGGISYLTTQSNGYYSFIVDTGQQKITYHLPTPWESSNNNTQYNINIQTDSTYSGLDFGIIPEFTKGDMTVDITTSNTVCNNTTTIWLTVRNEGTETITNVDLDLWVDPAYSVLNSGGGTQSGNHISWNLPGNFSPFIYAGQDSTFSVTVLIPWGPQNTSFIDSARVTPVQPNLIELSASNNFSEVSNTILCSYDPNDKRVLPNKCFYNELDTLDFTIRFQNTGNYPATTVTLIDSLDLEKLDIMSLQVLGASHDYEWSLKVPSVLEVVFDNIMLVDSSVSFNESQGFFKYRIVVRDSLVNLQPSATPAFIYFDLNAPVVTNLPEVNFIHPGIPYTNLQDICNGQSVTVGNNTYTTSGTYTDTISCDSIIVTVLTVNTSTSNTSNQTSCSSYTWIDGVTYTSSNNTATYTSTNAAGCDSVITLDLTITGTPIATITQIGVDLEVSIADTYNWNTTETTQTITPTANGTYWCIVTDANGCISDTAFFEVTNIVSSINEINKDKILLRITNILGQETPYKKNTTLFYIYDDGTVEKRIIID